MAADLARLRSLLDTEPALAPLLHAMRRSRIQGKSTTVGQLARNYDPPGDTVECRGKIMHGLRILEDCGFGRLVDPTLRARARFAWHVQPAALSAAALNANLSLQPGHILHASAAVPAPPGPPPEKPLPAGWRRHTFPLRPEADITLDLPENLTDPEAARLGHFLKSLAGLAGKG